MGNANNVVGLAISTLTEKYGPDFSFEEGDIFVFCLRNGVLILSYEDKNMKVQILGDEVIPLDAEFEGIFADE